MAGPARSDLGAESGKELGGRLVIPTAGREGGLLAAALEGDAGKRVVGDTGDVLRKDVCQKPELALRPSRANSLMPFVTTPPSSLAAATTVPPGHMQKL